TIGDAAGAVDQLVFVVDQPHEEGATFPDVPSGTLEFPMRVALAFPPSTTSVAVTVQGWLGGVPVAGDARTVTVAPNGYGSASFTLVGPGAADGGGASDLGPPLFMVTTPITGAGVPVALAVGDLDGDHRLDLVYANTAAGSGGNPIGVALNRGGGAFAGSTFLAQPGAPTSVMAVDVDGDQKLDVVATSAGIGEYYLGRGDGTFGGAISFAVANAGYAVAAELDGDTLRDVAYTVVAPGAPAVQVLAGASIPLGNNGGAYPVDVMPGHLTAGDLDGDGRPDLIVIGDDGANHTVVDVLLHTPSNTAGSLFGAKTRWEQLPSTAGVALADVDLDQHTDVLVSTVQGLYVLPGTGGGALGGLVISAGAPLSEHIAIADFDGDGLPDAAFAEHAGRRVVILRNTGARHFAPWQVLSVDRNPAAIVTADFDGDGKPDLATANQGDGTISVLLNRSHFP